MFIFKMPIQVTLRKIVLYIKLPRLYFVDKNDLVGEIVIFIEILIK